MGTSDGAVSRVTGIGASGVVERRELFDRLSGATRVTVLSAPPGSGKTMLLRSWISGTKLAESVAWVTVGRDERDPQRFWPLVLGALRATGPGSKLVQAVTAAPDLDGWAVIERLLKDLAPLDDRLWLVIDDAHQLDNDLALRQLELLVMRAPPGLRFVLATRHDVRLGLHRLRLEGELAEIREPDLRFSLAEARELFAAAGAEVPERAVAMLHERTEGWAAGLRLAALSLAGNPDQERFAAGFSGTERTVAEYLLAEVLDRQREEVRRLLLRTSVLERVNGELADLLTGDVGGEGVLQDLEEANAFVMSLDAARSWFRYHQMFAGLLVLELRRSVPEEVTGLHRTASAWFAEHGYPVEAIRHAQSAGDWDLAARLLADHWPGLHLDGQNATIRELIAGFPPGATADAELAALIAADELARGSLEAADRYLVLAEHEMASVSDARQGQARLLTGIVRLLVARQRGNLRAEATEAQRLRAMATTPVPGHPELGEELRALALISLGYAQGWTARDDGTVPLAQGISMARRIGRPYLEFTGLAYQAAIEASRTVPGAEEHSGQAIELAEQHGWTDDTAVGVAYTALGGAVAWHGRLDEAEACLRRAERTIRPEAEAVAALAAQYIRGQLQLARGKAADALDAFRTAERLAGHLAAPHPFARPVRAWLLHAQIRLGETNLVERALAGLDPQEREHGGMRIITAILRLTTGDPGGALAVLAPVTGGAVRVGWRTWLVEAFLLTASAWDMLGDSRAAENALERALDCAEPDGALLWFLLHPLPDLLERHTRHRTAHAALVAEIHSLLADRMLASRPAEPLPAAEPLNNGELRVLRYLPTNLTSSEIAGELSLSRNTVKAHIRSLYAKLGAHSRTEAVARARGLGLLAPGSGRM